MKITRRTGASIELPGTAATETALDLQSAIRNPQSAIETSAIEEQPATEEDSAIPEGHKKRKGGK